MGVILISGIFKHFEDDVYWRGEGRPVLQYIFNIGLMFSQVANVFLLGDCDETISSRLGRCVLDPNAPTVLKTLAKAVDKVLGDDHCVKCIEPQLTRQKELWHWSSTEDYPKPAERRQFKRP